MIVADDGSVNLEALRDRYRQRRDLADFYQSQVTVLNTAPVQAWSVLPLVISLAALMISTHVFSEQVSLNIVLGAVVLGMGAPMLSKWAHGKEAELIRQRYLAEHGLLFPDCPSVELVGFLLKGKHIS